MRASILVVAHDVNLRATLARWLIAAGYWVELAESVKRAREVLTSERVDLALIAPERLVEAGAELVHDLARDVARLIVVAEQPESAARTEIGARDHIALPLREDEVLACISAALDDQAGASERDEPEWLHFECGTIDVAGRTFVDAGGSEVPLTRAEFSLLLTLARHPGRVLSRDQLRSGLNGRVSDAFDRSIDVLIMRLRRKIEADPKEPRIIVTMPGEGYKFAVAVTTNAPVQDTRTTASAVAAPRPDAPFSSSSPAPAGAWLVSRLFAQQWRTTAAGAALVIAGIAAGLVWSHGTTDPVEHIEASPSKQVSELVWQASQAWGNGRGSQATAADARNLLQRALRLEESNIEANARFAGIVTASVENGWSNDRSTDLLLAERALDRVLRIDPNHVGASLSRCEWFRAKLRYEDGLRFCEEVLARYPTSTRALKEIGYDKAYLGRAEEALEAFAQADQLEPNSPRRWTWLQGRGFTLLLLGRNEEAIVWLRRAAAEPQGSGRAFAWLAAAYALTGRDDEARAALREFRQRWPTVTLSSSYFRRTDSARAMRQFGHVLEGLRMAGLPE
jgi:DNA-binding response OmpR family regulator/tetratricopeptide (TPR) repeat protein